MAIMDEPKILRVYYGQTSNISTFLSIEARSILRRLQQVNRRECSSFRPWPADYWMRLSRSHPEIDPGAQVAGRLEV